MERHLQLLAVVRCSVVKQQAQAGRLQIYSAEGIKAAHHPHLPVARARIYLAEALKVAPIQRRRLVKARTSSVDSKILRVPLAPQAALAHHRICSRIWEVVEQAPLLHRQAQLPQRHHQRHPYSAQRVPDHHSHQRPAAHRQQQLPQVDSSALPHRPAQQALPRLQQQVQQPKHLPVHPHHRLNLVSQVRLWTRF